MTASPNYRRGFGWNLAFNVLTKVTTPLIGIVVANRLGPAVMGAYWLIVTILLLSDIFRDSAFMRVYLREPERSESIDESYAGYSVLGHGLLAVVVLAIAPFLASVYHQPELNGGLELAALAIVVNGFSALPFARLVRDGRFKEAGFAESMGSILSSLVALSWVLKGGGFWALAIMPPIRSVIVVIIASRCSPCRIRFRSEGFMRRVFGPTSTISAINFLWVGFSVGDQLLVSKLFGVAVGGTFGAGKMMMQGADVLAKPIMQTTTVALANRKADPAEVSRILYKSLSAFLLAVAPVYVAAGFFAHPLVYGLLSSKFAGTVAIIPALCVYYSAVYPGSFAGDALVMAEKEKIPLRGWIATYVFLAISLASFWRGLDLVTLTWILTLGLLIANTNTMIFAVRRYPPSLVSLQNLRRSIVPLAVTAGVCFGISRPYWNDISTLLVGVLAVPLVHTLAIGAIFNHNPLSLFRKGAVNKLWSRL